MLRKRYTIPADPFHLLAEPYSRAIRIIVRHELGPLFKANHKHDEDQWEAANPHNGSDNGTADCVDGCELQNEPKKRQGDKYPTQNGSSQSGAIRKTSPTTSRFRQGQTFGLRVTVSDKHPHNNMAFLIWFGLVPGT
ncbi:uncharacterized protein SPPG_09167 [Spizellomyces punctatus DAOM BR117]|uniref:Uncharacterized protein n=1 Tax=Spizellomyces punctatus (strain DAOM BR117) TaxID=645134 RepID=A0A0L0HJ98_SPIPD|nr:uncharacterized protein SPPG_09167 [Spizellomyces punctatus DAOM BR117]KND00914.1 hypothetical protein SPPG_09167 [Spizellomyces punctatus DAOM BR117]|eukprot:XP_016608953.1 hypothetical protein SPPG_09167 [Spizellomyces punctatus DAOM BR117]